MNSKYKFLCVILACVLILSLFSSCAGIGDGALFDNITTGDPKEITLESEDGIVCKLVAYYAEGKEMMDEAVLNGAQAEEIYAYLNDSSNYTNAVDEVAMSHPYIHVTFEGIEELKIDLDSNNAVGGIEEFYVYSSDNVDITNVNLDSGRTGHLEGSYEKLFKYIEKHGAAMGYFCNLSTSDAPQALIRASGEDVYTMLLTLKEGEYSGNTGYKPLSDYISLSFFGSESISYIVDSNNSVFKFDASQAKGDLYAPVGVMSGIYKKAQALLESALNRVTEEEKEAHLKLNCLRVDMQRGMSRSLMLSEFADIGGIYLKHMTNDEAYFVLVYFESCSLAELEEKLFYVKAKGIAYQVSKIHVADAYYGTAFAE